MNRCAGAMNNITMCSAIRDKWFSGIAKSKVDKIIINIWKVVLSNGFMKWRTKIN